MKHTLSTTAALIVLSGSAMAQLWDGDTSTAFEDGLNWDSGIAPTDGGWTINGGSPNDASLTSFHALDPTLSLGPAGDAWVGNGATGTLNVDAGGTLDTSDQWIFLGSGGGTGTLNVNNGGSAVSDTFIRMDSSTSSVNVASGGSVNVGAIFGGGTTSVTGTASLTTTFNGGGDDDIQNLVINNLTAGGSVSAGRNAIIQTTGNTIAGGSVSTGREFWVGNGSGNTAELTISSGSVTATDWIGVGRDGATGTLNIDGGTIVQNNQFLAFGSNLGAGDGNATINQTAGSLTAPAGRLGEESGSVAVYNISGGSLTLTTDDLDLGWNDNTHGELNISGTATVTSAGVTTVAKWDSATGELNVAGSSATINLADLVVGLGDDLSETGAVGTIGFVADAGGISTISAATINLSSVDGDLLSVDLSSYAGPHVNITLIDGTSVLGEFTGLAQGDLVATGFGGGDYYIDYSTGEDVRLTTTAIIPEPASALLGGLGLLALLRRRRQG